MGKWSDEARLRVYIAKHGEEEGRRRFAAAQGREERRAARGGEPISDPEDLIDQGPPSRVPKRGARTGRKQSTPNRAVPKKQLRGDLMWALKGVDWGARSLYPFNLVWQEEDKLEDSERALLADALADEVAASERLMALYAKASESIKHGPLVFALLRIAQPRIERRFAAMSSPSPATGAPPDGAGGGYEPTQAYSGDDAAYLAAGAAPVGHWQDGAGQEPPAGGPGAGEVAQLDRPQEQSGRHPLSGRGNGTIRFRHGRSAGLPDSVGAAAGA